MLDEEPRIPDHLMLVWHAFRVLSQQRSMGYSVPNPIVYTEMVGIAGDLGIDREDAVYFLQGLDSTYMDEAVRQFERKQAQVKK